MELFESMGIAVHWNALDMYFGLAQQPGNLATAQQSPQACEPEPLLRNSAGPQLAHMLSPTHERSSTQNGLLQQNPENDTEDLSPIAQSQVHHQNLQDARDLQHQQVQQPIDQQPEHFEITAFGSHNQAPTEHESTLTEQYQPKQQEDNQVQQSDQTLSEQAQHAHETSENEQPADEQPGGKQPENAQPGDTHLEIMRGETLLSEKLASELHNLVE